MSGAPINMSESAGDPAIAFPVVLPAALTEKPAESPPKSPAKITPAWPPGCPTVFRTIVAELAGNCRPLRT